MSIYPEVRKTDLDRELDRGTWPDLDAIGFKFVTEGEGEAIAGPFFFGRPFDVPPSFSFSASLKEGSTASSPQITVGVSEWIQDEQDMYVGAYLWVVISDNCFDPPTVPTSEGVVMFEDVEDVLAKQGGGPEGDEIPYMAMTRFDHQGGSDPDRFERYKDLYWPSRYPETFPDQIPFASRSPGDLSSPYRWMQGLWDNGFRASEDAELIQRWRITDERSRSGQYSLFCDDLIPPENLFPFAQSQSGLLHVANILACMLLPENDSESPIIDERYFWGWRCDPGTEVKISFYRMHDWTSFTLGSYARLTCRVRFAGVDPETGENQEFGGGQWRFRLDPAREESDGLVANEWYYNELTEGFATQTNDSPIAPEGTQYVKIYFVVSQSWLDEVFHSQELPPFKTWLDDIKIEFVGPQSPRRTPTFDVATRFEGNALKGYAGVHPLRSYEGPEKVVLS